jgi:hypothetical protein
VFGAPAAFGALAALAESDTVAVPAAGHTGAGVGTFAAASAGSAGRFFTLTPWPDTDGVCCTGGVHRSASAAVAGVATNIDAAIAAAAAPDSHPNR